MDPDGTFVRKSLNGPTPANSVILKYDGQGHGVAIEYDGWPNLFEKWVLEGSI